MVREAVHDMMLIIIYNRCRRSVGVMTEQQQKRQLQRRRRETNPQKRRCRELNRTIRIHAAMMPAGRTAPLGKQASRPVRQQASSLLTHAGSDAERSTPTRKVRRRTPRTPH